MSTRTTLRPKMVMNGVSMAANQTGLVTIMQSVVGVGYAFSWTGTNPSGFVSVQVSNDYSIDADGVVSNPGTWTTLPMNILGDIQYLVPISGNSGTAFLDVTVTMGYAVRPYYTSNSANAGSLTATVAGKVT